MEFPYKTADVTRKSYGVLSDGTPVDAYFLMNRKGLRAEVLAFGGLVDRIVVIGGDLKKHNVVLGARDLAAYESGEFLSAALRRGEALDLPVMQVREEGRHVVMACEIDDPAARGLALELHYALTDANEFVVGREYALSADAPGPVPLPTSVPLYFNLAGQEPGNALDHALAVDAGRACDLVRCGDRAVGASDFFDVEGTPADYRTGKALAEDILLPECLGGDVDGFDVCFEPDAPADGAPRYCATLYCSRSRVYMDVSTDAALLRLSTFQPLGGGYVQGKGVSPNGNHSGILLEPVFEPGTTLAPGERVSSVAVYRFEADYPEGYSTDSGNLGAII